MPQSKMMSHAHAELDGYSISIQARAYSLAGTPVTLTQCKDIGVQ